MGHVPETEHLQSTTVLSSILWSEKLTFLMKFLLWSATSPRYRQLFSRWCSSSVEVGGESCSPDRKILSEEIIRMSRCTHAPRYPPFIPFHIHAYCYVTVMSSHWQTSCDKWILQYQYQVLITVSQPGPVAQCKSLPSYGSGLQVQVLPGPNCFWCLDENITISAFTLQKSQWWDSFLYSVILPLHLNVLVAECKSLPSMDLWSRLKFYLSCNVCMLWHDRHQRWPRSLMHFVQKGIEGMKWLQSL